VTSECPKCAAAVDPGSPECTRCGVIFAKVQARGERAPAPAPVAFVQARPERAAVDPLRQPAWVAKCVLLIGLVVWTWLFATAPAGAAANSWLHLPNLVFHEAGHVLFAVFGRFVRVLGGSLLQFALPVALAVVFLRQHDRTGAAVCVWWAGENLLDLAPYISDARALQLVLLGGKTGAEVEGHDWEYLLTQLGWLRFDRVLGLWAHRMGLLIMVTAVIFGTVSLARDRPQRLESSFD
jgi:hypothetical protein